MRSWYTGNYFKSHPCFILLPGCCPLKQALRVTLSGRASRWSRRLCSVAYARKGSDSSQPLQRWYNNDKCCIHLAPARHSALCGFHYGSMVSISPDFSRRVGTEIGFNLGWTLKLHLWTFRVRPRGTITIRHHHTPLHNGHIAHAPWPKD